jgi:hypothetical protein
MADIRVERHDAITVRGVETDADDGAVDGGIALDIDVENERLGVGQRARLIDGDARC